MVNEKDNIVEHILHIKSADRSDSALYTCTALNAYGKDEYNIQVILQGMNFLLSLFYRQALMRWR